uniref:Trichome birefringence-like C-terminal domain-containing protein n=1 Tax=Oryza glumipatula TaxID=40148 RepID=A0A0E0BMN9_9ORYZ
MVCMVEHFIPDGRKIRVYNGSLISFKAFEYNATIDFYWSPLLLESNSDNPIIHRVEYRIIRADRIEKHANVWKDADFIVFNSYLWWRKQRDGMMMKVMYGSFEDGDAKLDEVEMVDGYEIALKKLTEYLGANINKNKTRIFFAGSSPAHSWASNWGGDDNNKCLNETEPIQIDDYRSATTDYGMMDKAKEIFGTLEPKGIHVQILNITQLSEYRKDAHPTIFRRQYVPLTKEQIANPSIYADCTHWCLPGVPDVWNEFLYAYIMHK